MSISIFLKGPSGGSRILERGSQYTIKARVARVLGGPEGTPPTPQNQRRESASGRRGCIAAGYPRKAQENKRSRTDSISPSLAA